MRLRHLTLLSSLASYALADVEFVKPAAGATEVGGSVLDVTWKESGTAPLITTLSSYQLFLMAGGNDDDSQIQLYAIEAAGVFTVGDYAASATISTGLGNSTTNAYFLKMISVSSEGGELINYSDRFTLTGMTGSFTAAVTAGIAAVSGTDGPETVDDVGNTDTSTTTADVAADSFTVAYHLQTGLTKYAPMQPLPPTSITATNTSPLNPTSAFTIATTYMAAPTLVTTITQSVTYSFSSIENTAAAASQPATATGDMAKFLARWKD